MSTRLGRSAAIAGLFAVLTGCASIDFDYPRVESTLLIGTGDTYLETKTAALVASKPDAESGFYPLPDGIDALTARLLLARRAERSIDTQYYLIKADTTGLAFIDALLRAADRGGRLRLVLDDFFTSGSDAGCAGLGCSANL